MPLALRESFDTANIRDELVQTVRVTMRNFGGTFAAEVLPVLAATRARDAELIEAFRTKFLRARRRRTTEAFERAIARGELPEDVDEALLPDSLGARSSTGRS